MKRIAFKGRRRQAGVAAVEFSLVAIIFFTLVFATLELARVEYLLKVTSNNPAFGMLGRYDA